MSAEFTEASLRQLGFEAPAIEKVRKKHAGGSSGKEGYRYEDHYIVYLLLQAAEPYFADGRNFEIKEGDFCFVDDVVHRADLQITFCQLKSSPSETWGREGGQLKHDFRQQKMLCEAAKLQFSLRLVTPHESRVQSFRNDMPDDLKGCSEVVLFPRFGRRPEFWAPSSPACNALARLCAIDGDSSSNRESVAVAFFNAWYDLALGPDRYCSVAKVIEKIRQDSTVPLRSDIQPNPDEWVAAEKAVSRIEGLQLTVKNGFCLFEYKSLSRIVARCDTPAFQRFVSRLIAQPPANFDKFMEVLP